MEAKINALLKEIESFSAESREQVEQFRIKLLSKKGEVSALFDDFKNVPPAQKRAVGQSLNELKNKAQSKLDEALLKFEEGADKAGSGIDWSKPGQPITVGSRHPISLVREQIIEIFSRIGFTTADGPEIEDDWHNFTALNFPENHPARDMQDTFFVDNDFALRTHTSSVQVRAMENRPVPMRILAPGRVYRNEAISARAHCFFHQVVWKLHLIDCLI